MPSPEYLASTKNVDFSAILRALTVDSVEFIVVGLMSAVLNGVPVITWDLDIIPSLKCGNLDRLQTALARIETEFRFVTPTLQRHYTRFGPLDVLGAIGADLTYEDLLPHSTELEVGDDLRVRVLDLDKLIEVKEFLNTEKDRAVLPLLRRTLIERNRRGTL